MLLRSLPLRRAAGRVTLLAASAAAVRLVASCVIADPPSEPLPPPSSATIVQGALSPLSGEIIEWPSEFYVPVQLGAPSDSFSWGIYVDYPTNPTPLQNGTSVQGNSDSLIRAIEVTVTAPVTRQCHTVQFFTQINNVNFAPGPGGDEATWVYNPSGATGACPVYDAGIYADGAFPPPPATGLSPPIHVDAGD